MSPQSVFIYCVFHDSALHRIVFVALLVDVERVILETDNGTKIHRLGILFDQKLTCKYRLGSSAAHLA